MAENGDQFVQSEIEKFISEMIFRPVSKDELLVTDRVVDSIALVELVVFLEARFKVKISAHEMTAENFDQPDRIVKLVRSKQSLKGPAI